MVVTLDSSSDVPNTIFRYLHCARCIREKPKGIAPQDWATFSIGITPEGLQVWCNRHQINIGDFRWAESDDAKKNPRPLDLSCGACEGDKPC